jgi:hypothetical protein
MDAKTIKDIRRRLSMEYENLIKSNNRKRLAAEEITVENTEDEGDLATISHDRDLLYNLHEGQFRALEIHPASHEGAGPWSIWGMRPLRERHQRETAGGRAVGHAMHSVPRRNGSGAHFITYGGGWRPGRRRDGAVISDAEFAGDPYCGSVWMQALKHHREAHR